MCPKNHTKGSEEIRDVLKKLAIHPIAVIQTQPCLSTNVPTESSLKQRGPITAKVIRAPVRGSRSTRAERLLFKSYARCFTLHKHLFSGVPEGKNRHVLVAMNPLLSRATRGLLLRSGIRHVQTKSVRPWNLHTLVSGESASRQALFIAPTKYTLRATKSEKPSSSDANMVMPRRQLKPLKAVITLTPSAVEHLRSLLNSPNPKLIRVGVRNRGCSGLTYNLEYVDHPGKYDEEVVQDGVKVLIDSKALFSIIGSEMDWVDNKLASRFVFTNPNSKGQCGCGESFMV